MAEPKRPRAARAAPPPAAPTNTNTGGGTLRIQLVRSLIGNPARQRATVQALGLRRIRQIVTHADSPATRGMVARVPHLVRILEE